MEIFYFFAGMLFYFIPAPLLLIILSITVYIFRNYRAILGFLGGCVLAFIHHWVSMPTGMPKQAILSSAVVQGQIVSIPQQNPGNTRFLFAITSLNSKPASALIQLSWYTKVPPLQLGQRWQLVTKLKKPRNFANPGAFDYVHALEKKHVYWVGYVRDGKLLPPISTHFSWLRLRQTLASKLEGLIPDQATLSISKALTLNLTQEISSQYWDLFRRTGTVHLFGISGEHIALVFGVVYSVMHFLWRNFTWGCLRLPASFVANLIAIPFAGIFVLLAGFEPPAQRAFVGCILYALSNIVKKRYTPWQVWRYALVIVLVIEPHALFMQGFYFSFLAVACLLLTSQRWRFAGYKQQLLLQFSCLLGLMPLSLFWYDYASLNSYLANLFAIPLVGLFIVPMALLTLFSGEFFWGQWLVYILVGCTKLLLWWLKQIEHLAIINFENISLGLIESMAIMCALLILLLLPLKPFRMIAGLWIILSFFPPRLNLPYGTARIDVLDVGQGLAVAVHTQHHFLLFDTGDRFYKGSDLGTMVILPYLKTLQIKKINALVISHADKDHEGGLNSIMHALPVRQLIRNEVRTNNKNCHQMRPWIWDGVTFNFLKINPQFPDKNNNSCVLKISTATRSALLPGDIEAKAETLLLKNFGTQLQADYLIVPHHGSKTSSSLPFIHAVKPSYAVASLGFANRFYFPHQSIIDRFQAANIRFLRTDRCGLTRIDLGAHSSKQPLCFREHQV
ncbi:MAG: DNA internalization-related competence protein ComEC/Rec2 [Legionella sp. 40-6]|nr:DNA internalization-related competence protein ComEC/Rec2 [Legionella sp.]OJY33154.1 MAG: DNA internalization-related competence protein ComEC/Rec2 [Legionella sp. 40-6]